MYKINFVKLFLSILLTESIGLFGSAFTSVSIPVWYEGLQKPFFSPPNWVFAPVWFLLYFLMGISLYLVWQKGMQNQDVHTAVWVFLIHLVFNASWSMLFFGLRSPLAGLVGIFILWWMIVLVILKFCRISEFASALLLPYFMWVSFAMLLNYYIWRLN